MLAGTFISIRAVTSLGPSFHTGETGEPVAGPAPCPQGLCCSTEELSFPRGRTAVLKVFLSFLLPAGESAKMCWDTNASVVCATPRPQRKQHSWAVAEPLQLLLGKTF